MSIQVVIQGTVINFPSSGESPNWSQPIIDFAEAVQNALSGIVGTFDVPPQVQIIDSYNPGSNVIIPNLSFSTTNVVAAFIRYSVYRQTTSITVAEAGTITMVYNPTAATGSKWEYDHKYTGNASINFTITDVGQVEFTTLSLSGLNHTGTLTYTAQALLPSY